MYSNVLQTVWVYWQVPVLSWLKLQTSEMHLQSQTAKGPAEITSHIPSSLYYLVKQVTRSVWRAAQCHKRCKRYAVKHLQ